jgi:hypothetical protein
MPARLDALADNLELDERTLQRRSRALRERIDTIEQPIAAAVRSSPLTPFANGTRLTLLADRPDTLVWSAGCVAGARWPVGHRPL